MSLPHRLNLTLDEDEVKVLLFWAHAASECRWTDQSTSQKMERLAKRIQVAVGMQMPYLRDFLKDKGVEIEKFTLEPEER